MAQRRKRQTKQTRQTQERRSNSKAGCSGEWSDICQFWCILLTMVAIFGVAFIFLKGLGEVLPNENDSKQNYCEMNGYRHWTSAHPRSTDIKCYNHVKARDKLHYTVETSGIIPKAVWSRYSEYRS